MKKKKMQGTQGQIKLNTLNMPKPPEKALYTQ